MTNAKTLSVDEGLDNTIKEISTEKIVTNKKIGKFFEHRTLSEALNNNINNKDIFVICIGTDSVTGDSFGPFVGTFLTNLGYKNVLGTIDNPVHANNFEEVINKLPKNKIIIAVDACLGNKDDVGTIILQSGQLRAGNAVGKKLTPIGDFTIKGIVAAHTDDINLNHLILYNTRLSTIIKMAEQCAKALSLSFPLKGKNKKRRSKKDKLITI